MLHSSLVRLLRKHLHGVSVRDELSQRIGHKIRHFHAKRILIDKCRVTQPIVDGVSLDVGNDHKSIICIEIQAFYTRQLGISITEIHRKMIGFIACNAQQITVGQRFVESTQRDIIRQEVGISHALNVGNMQRVGP